jgi:hypothetical protein
MEFIGAGLTNLASILIFALVAAGVAKTFQMAGILSEIKDQLAEIKRNTEPQVPISPFASTESAESLLRAVSAELDHPVATSEPERQGEFEPKN